MLHLEKLKLLRSDFRLCADWSVMRGEKIALIGPSGAGKSTLLAAIAGFLVPERGNIFWEGRNLGKDPAGIRPLSILFQEQNLFPHLTVYQNLGLGLRPNLRLNDVQKKRVQSALQRVGLDGFEKRLPGELSGGQAARAALARSLLRAKPLLLLDEPFSALGPGLKAEMLALVDELAREMKMTVLLVSHNPDDVQNFADKASFIANGTAHIPQPVETLFTNPPPALQHYLGKIP